MHPVRQNLGQLEVRLFVPPSGAHPFANGAHARYPETRDPGKLEVEEGELILGYQFDVRER